MNSRDLCLPVPFAALVRSAAVLVLAMAPAFAADRTSPARDAKPISKDVPEHYKVMPIEGWTVYVNDALSNADAELSHRVLELLRHQLYQIRRRVPKESLIRLRQVPIWMELTSPKVRCACYHPNIGWLKENGYEPAKEKSVEIGNAETFLKWTADQPWMVLHELAHAYHDQFLRKGYDNPAILAAYKEAMEAKLYGEMLHIVGKTRPAYAAKNQMEYFAEATEAFFGTNDFYPFVRAELQQHDPALFRLLEQVWNGEPELLRK